MSPHRRRKAPSRPPARQRPATGGDFWGTRDVVAEGPESIRPTDDPAAMIRSLGPPPVHGRETAAAQYFEAVYDKAVQLAFALASANGLLDVADDDTHDEVSTSS